MIFPNDLENLIITPIIQSIFLSNNLNTIKTVQGIKHKRCVYLELNLNQIHFILN